MKIFKLLILATITILLSCNLCFSGVWTTNQFIYVPSLGATGQTEKNLYDSGMDKLDARLAKATYVTDPIYGAKGDGFTDDTTAILSAVASGGTVILPPGNYLTTDNITSPSITNLKFQEGAVLTISTTKTLTINGPLEAGLYQVFSCAGTGQVVFGSGVVQRVYPEWWGAKRDGSTNDSTAVNAALNSNCGEVFFSEGTYKGNFTNPSTKTRLVGAGMSHTYLESYSDTGWVLTITGQNGTWRWWSISGISFQGKTGTTFQSNGVTLGGTYNSGDEIIGRISFRDCSFANFDKCVRKPFGNIGDTYIHCAFDNANYHFYQELSGSTNFHGGNTVFEKCEFHSAQLASQYWDSFDANNQPGQSIYKECIFEYNSGFVFFVWNYGTEWQPGIVLDNCWFEGNHSSGSVTINGTAYTPKDVRLRNCPNFEIRNTPIGHYELINSQVFAYNPTSRETHSGTGPAGYEFITKDADSAFFVNGANVVVNTTNPGYYASTIHNLKGARPWGTTVVTKPRSKISTQSDSLRVMMTFADANSYTWNDSVSGTYTGITVADGRIFDSCCELSLPAGKLAYPAIGTVAQVNANQYIVWTVDLKQVSGGQVKFWMSSINYDHADSYITIPTSWTTFAGIAKGNSATFYANFDLISDPAQAGVIRISALQIHSFANYEDALKFLDSGVFCAGARKPRVIYSTAAPTTGTWAQGDICYTTTPTAGNPPGWVCTTAGSPGIWKAMANLGS